MIETILLAGATPARREAAIAALLHDHVSSAALLEGLPDGTPALTAESGLTVARIAAACPCCSGDLVLRVTLNRLLRANPTHLYIGIAAPSHLHALRTFLAAPPYANLLQVTKEVDLESRSQ